MGDKPPQRISKVMMMVNEFNTTLLLKQLKYEREQYTFAKMMLNFLKDEKLKSFDDVELADI